MTSRERDKQMKHAWYLAHGKSRRKNAASQKNQTNVEESSNRAGVAQLAESSASGASREAVGDGSLFDLGNLLSTSVGNENFIYPRDDHNMRWESIGYPEDARDEFDWRWVSAAELEAAQDTQPASGSNTTTSGAR